MDLAVEDSTAWSEAIFCSVSLGDKRLTRRLIQIANSYHHCLAVHFQKVAKARMLS
jgi:hypothetical protein